MTKKFAFSGGLPGCLPDYHSDFIYDTEEKAKEAAVYFYGLSEREAAELGEFSPLYIHGERYHDIGAGVIEIFSDFVEEEGGEI